MDYYTPQKAVVIAGSRVGSTMLCNALDSHPLIACERHEPLNPKTSIYLKAGLTVDQTLGIVLVRPGYQWCMCKISYRQLRKHVSLEHLAALGVTKFVHLWRENPLRVVVSAALNTALRGERPTHAWETPPLQPIILDGQDILKQARLYLERVEQRKTELQGYDTLTLTYETLHTHHLSKVTGDLWLTHPFQEFFNVPYFLLKTYTQPINPYPLPEIILNWKEVRTVLLDSEFAKFVESEEL